MNDYTVVFDHPDDCTPEVVHITTLETRYVHLMFLGKLANEWEYGWEDMRFAEQTDLSLSHGAIMIKDKPLRYDILPGHLEPGSEAAMLT